MYSDDGIRSFALRRPQLEPPTLRRTPSTISCPWIDLAEGTAGGVQGGRHGRDLDRLLNSGWKQREIESGALTHQYLDVLSDEFAEALLGNGDGVEYRREQGSSERADSRSSRNTGEVRSLKQDLERYLHLARVSERVNPPVRVLQCSRRADIRVRGVADGRVHRHPVGVVKGIVGVRPDN